MEGRKLRVWWNPQVGACTDSFYIPVKTPEEGKKIMDVLAYYDCYQMNQNVKGDYCNTGGLEIFNEEEGEWEDFYYENEDVYCEDVDEYVEQVSEPDKREAINADAEYMASQVHFD